VSGLGDYMAEDDRDAIRIAREILAKIDWPHERASVRDFAPPRYDAEELLGVMPMDHKRPVDMKEVIARIADESDFLEFGANYGPATVCGHVRLEGWSLGIITNNGPIDPAGATKATHFIQACCQSGTPILYLNNTTGFMVGRAYEEAGMIKHGAKMIQAVSNATVPQITIYCGASFRGRQPGMCGRGFHPRFCFLAERQDGGDGRRAGGADDGHRPARRLPSAGASRPTRPSCRRSSSASSIASIAR
jgi:geranyl-CoA carboxylase beta subunit